MDRRVCEPHCEGISDEGVCFGVNDLERRNDFWISFELSLERGRSAA